MLTIASQMIMTSLRWSQPATDLLNTVAAMVIFSHVHSGIWNAQADGQARQSLRAILTSEE